MDPTSRFAELVQSPEPTLGERLDEAALLVAAHARPDLDVASYLSVLDEIARSCPAPTVAGVREAVFVHARFHGNAGNYYDPTNSLLDRVIERRTGIPITLAIVAMAVGRRVGVQLTGVGMPGHFLLGAVEVPRAAPRPLFLDPFDGGRERSWAECRDLFHRLHGPAARWDPAYLAPSGPRAILRRVLTNLASTLPPHAGGADLGWLERLAELVPPEPVDERVAAAWLN